MNTPLDSVLSLLEEVKPLPNGQYLALCPAHDDHKPSLSVGLGEDGRVLFHCHAGCQPQEVVDAMGLVWSDLFSDDGQEKQGRHIVDRYPYHDAAGDLLFEVVRYEPKDFRVRRSVGKNGWHWNLDGVNPVLYRLPELLAADPEEPVFIVESEKDVDRLAGLRIVATCSPFGAGKWTTHQEHYNPVLRDRRVVVIPDNDGPGRKHAEQVIHGILDLAASVQVLELPGLPEKGDVSTWLDNGSDPSELVRPATEAPPAVEWLENRDTKSKSEPLVPPLPLDARLPANTGQNASPWLDEYIEFSRKWSPRAYDGFHEACGLWVLSVVAARRVVLHLGKPWHTPLFIALCARTSLFAKSTTAEIAVGTLKAAGLDWLLAADDATPQKFLQDLTLRVPDGFDTLPAHRQDRIRKRLALTGQRGWFYEEFGQHLHAMNRKDGPMADFRGIIRRFDDCKDRYEYGTISRGDDVVERPYLALLANLTPADLRPMTTRGHAMWNDGFWARFAFVTPGDEERKRGRFPHGSRDVPKTLTQPLEAWHSRLCVPQVSITDAMDGAGKPTGQKSLEVTQLVPKTCELGQGVCDAFYCYHDGLLDIVESNANHDLDGNYARFAEKALRIAILMASLENDDHVEMGHWARGQEIAERWRADLHALYHQTNEAEEDLETTRIVATIKRLGCPTIREIAQYTRGLDSADVKRHIENLVKAGEVVETEEGKTKCYSLFSVEV